jgi:protein TonB
LGAATLVCGTQLFLLATWDWDSTPSNVEPLAPASATISVELSDGKLAEPVAEHEVGPAPESVTKGEMLERSEPGVARSLAFQQPDILSETPQSTASTQAQVAPEHSPNVTAEARVGDRTPPSSANANLVVPAPRIMGEADVHRTAVGSSAAEPLIAAITGHGGVGDKTVLASTNEPAKDHADRTPESAEARLAAVAELGTKVTGFNRVKQISQASRSSPQKKAVPALTADKPQASKQPLPHKVAQRQQSQPDIVRQTTFISDAAAELKSKKSLKALLPQRASKPSKKKPSAQAEATEKPMPKLARTSETKNSPITPRWKPMGLAPADKPEISSTQNQQKGPGAGSYNAKIWSALARKKPKAGERGSTTVTFAIGPGGALRHARVSQSSSNPRLDQLAVATVRNAAPFPPPEILKNGTATYSIRIDFH